jgi:hypothetical protein
MSNAGLENGAARFESDEEPTIRIRYDMKTKTRSRLLGAGFCFSER